MNAKPPVILLAEDNPDDVALTLRAFKKNKIANEVVVVGDGAEALDWLFAKGAYADRDPSMLPHIVLLDLNMPKIGGIEVLKQIRADKRTRTLPVIILTTSKEEQDLTRAYEIGVNSYIRKPVNFAQFIEAVKTLELYWLVLNEVPPALRGEPSADSSLPGQ